MKCVKLADVSVIPQPVPDFAEGKTCLMRRTSSPAAGAPPYEIDSSEDRSYFFKAGCSTSCQAIVGTPPALVQRRRSINCIAISAFQRCISTSLAPLAVAALRIAWHPATWKKGTETSDVFCGASGSGAGTGSPRRRHERANETGCASIEEIELRCVPSAPFGWPVVPDV